MSTWRILLVASLFPLGALAAPTQSDGLAPRLAAMIAAAVDDHGPGVSVLIARDGRILYRGARGMASLELGVPLKPEHVFRIGSITKMFTAAAVLKLSAQDRLTLADPLSRFVPDFPNASHITLSELLSHTSGVSDGWESDPAKPLDTAHAVRLIAGVPPDFRPGESFSYSNSGYILLGAVLEKVTGMPWHEVIRTQLLEPLHLGATGFQPDESVVAHRVSGYSQDEHGRTVLAPFVSITGPGAAGALVSNVDDLFRWVHALTTDQALPPHFYQRMSNPVTRLDGTRVDYGFGLMLGTVRGEPVVEHNGGIEGFSSHLLYLPGPHVTVVVLANTDSGSPSVRSLAHRLAAMAMGRPYPDLQAVSMTSDQAKALTGTYRSSSGVTHVLALTAGTLTVKRAGGPAHATALTASDILFYPEDRTDYIQVVRDPEHRVIALDFYIDGLPPARHEARVQP